MKLQSTADSVIEATESKYPVFTDANVIPWTEWVIEGTHFKLLHLQQESGGFSMLLKVDPGNEAPIHEHIGAVETFVIEGEFGYGDDRGRAGCYAYEPAGIRHELTSPTGTVMFAVAHGPIAGYNPDGSIAAVIDGRSMYNLAKANNAHGHLNVDFDE